MAVTKNLASKEEFTKKFLQVAEENYNRYVTQREDIDESNEKADYMYKAAQNRTIAASQQSTHIKMDKDPRANVGSPLFYRIVNTMASILHGIFTSREDLFRFAPIGSDSASLSKEESQRAVDQLMSLARYTRKVDEIDRKIPEFCVSVFKLSNIFVMVQQKRVTRTVTVTSPVTEVLTDEEGNTITETVDQVEKEEEELVENHPSIVFPHPSSVYADRYIPNMKDQYCVIIETLKTLHELQSENAAGYFDKDQWEKFREASDSYKWDGTTGWEQKEQEQTNENKELNASGTLQFLQRDIFMYSPEDNGEWNEEADHKLLWATVIGNALSDSIPLRIKGTPDPDGEIPIEIIRVNPDNSDELYHTPISDIVLSNYAADCTILNLTIDNLSKLVDPPMTVLDGQHRIRDFTFKNGARWSVDRHDVVKQFDIKDATANTVNIRQQIQNEIKQALNADPSFLGEFAGARTSASEFLSVNQVSKNPVMMQMRYIITQLISFIGRKYISYWQAYGPPRDVMLITDDEKQFDPFKFRYDIITELVDEFIADSVRSNVISNVIQIIGGSEAMQRSEYHSVDIGELLKEYLRSNKFSADKIIMPSTNGDSVAIARRENDLLVSGEYIAPEDGQNDAVHLREHRAFRMQLNSLDESDPRFQYIPFLERHIAETEGRSGGGQGSVPSGDRSNTPGRVAGNQAAAALGGGQVDSGA